MKKWEQRKFCEVQVCCEAIRVRTQMKHKIFNISFSSVMIHKLIAPNRGRVNISKENFSYILNVM